MKFDLILAGVGGQGNILASQTIARCAMDAGFTVVNTETKGAAQRGGSVVSHVRISDREIFSPLVAADQADVLLGFEPLESLRTIRLLKKSGKFIINTHPIPTILANIKVDVYPSRERIISEIESRGLSGHFVNATQAARDLGDVLLTNVIMLGAFTAICDVMPGEAILEKLLGAIDVKYHEADILAFKRGQEIIREDFARQGLAK